MGCFCLFEGAQDILAQLLYLPCVSNIMYCTNQFCFNNLTKGAIFLEPQCFICITMAISSVL